MMEHNETKITLVKYPQEDDWMLCKQCTLVTINKKVVNAPDSAWKRKMLNARHSPIRELKFVFLLENIPYCNSVHFCRHVHAQPYVRTQRNDRQSKYDRNSARQDAPVNMILSMNAEELMIIANKRLCKQADEVTRQITKEMCNLAVNAVPELEGLLVPMCVYHGGLCHEFYSCKN